MMVKYSVSGSTLPAGCSIDMSFNKTFNSVNIVLGIQEILSALDDVLADYDMIDAEQFEKILDMADAIQSIAIIRNAEKICMNCDDPRACVNCENFAKIYDS